MSQQRAAGMSERSFSRHYVQQVGQTPARAVEALRLEAAKRLLALVDPQPVYARVDLVRDDDDKFLLMELELIEPALYLRTDSQSAERFARAFDRAVAAD